MMSYEAETVDVEAPPLLKGYLVKRGHIVKSWKNRFFVLELGRLSYFEDISALPDQPPYGINLKGNISLANIIAGGQTNDPMKIYLVDTVTHVELYMQANSPKEAKNWIQNLKVHAEFAKIYPSMTLLIDSNESRDIAIRQKYLKAMASKQTSEFFDVSNNRSDSNNSNNDDEAVELMLRESGATIKDIGHFSTTSGTSFTSTSAEVFRQSSKRKVSFYGGEIDSLTLELVKELKHLESETRKAEEKNTKNFNKTEVPILNSRIQSYEIRIASLKKRLKDAKSSAELDRKIEKMIALQDALKYKLYFPTSAITRGSQGVYFGFDKVWIERISGVFKLKLQALPEPEIHVSLDGMEANSGLCVNFMIGGFKLKAEAGTGLPSLSFEWLRIEMSIKISLTLTFDFKTIAWISSPENFNISVLSFKGPYGINRRVVASILAFVVPTIKSQILSMVPFELSKLIETFVRPFIISGSIDVASKLSLDSLSRPSHLERDLCATLGFSSQQFKLFVEFQKVIEKSQILSTVQELYAYKELMMKHGHWDRIKEIWDKLLVQFWLQMSESSTDNKLMAEEEKEVFSFPKLLVGLDEVMRNLVVVQLAILEVNMDIDFQNWFNFERMCLERQQREIISSPDSVDKEDRVKELSDMLLYLDQGNAMVNEMFQLDRIEFGMSGDIASGSTGEVRVIVQDMTAVGPMPPHFSLLEDEYYPYDYPIPTIMNLRYRYGRWLDGIMYRLASHELLELAHFKRFKKQEEEELKIQQNNKLSNTVFPLTMQHESSSGSLPNILPDYSLRGLEYIQSQSCINFVNKLAISQNHWKSILAHKLTSLQAERMIHARMVDPCLTFILDDDAVLSRGSDLLVMKMVQTKPIDTKEESQLLNTSTDTHEFMVESLNEMPSTSYQFSALKMKAKCVVPETRLRIILPALFRYINDYLNDTSKLFHYLAILTSYEKQDFVKFLDTSKLLFSYICYHFLQPDLALYFNISVCMTTDSQKRVSMSIKTFSGDNSTGVNDKRKTMHVTAPVYIGDFIYGIILLKQSLDNMTEEEGGLEDATTPQSATKLQEIDSLINYSLKIQKISCQNLKLRSASSVLGSNNKFYVKVKYGNQTFQTEAGSTSCTWQVGENECMNNMEFNATGDVLKHTDIQVEVLTWNRIRSHDHVGDGVGVLADGLEIKKSDAIDATTSSDEVWHAALSIDLFSKKFEYVGQVLVQYVICR